MTRTLFQRKVPEHVIVEEACEVLSSGGIAVLPTDTVPGIGCRADDIRAVRRLFRLKGRPADLPVPIILADTPEIRRYSPRLPAVFKRLAQHFWPGPMTIVVKSNGKLDPILGGGGETLGFRVPDFPLLVELVQTMECPIALTSANPHGTEPSGYHTRLLAWWNHKVDLIVLGRSTAPKPPSAVVDISSRPYRILRDGPLDREDITSVLEETGKHHHVP
jgi:L-threonylcarbamoyladenylate synthase